MILTITRLAFCILAAMVLVLGIPALTRAAVHTNTPLVISQIYGAAESPNASYNRDYVEIFNRGTDPVSLAGWSVQIAAVGSGDWAVTELNGTIAPGHYYLVQQGAVGNGAALPTPDAAGVNPISAQQGKIALVQGTQPLNTLCPTDMENVADLVGYGAGECAEEAPTERMAGTEALLRKGDGCTESDHNANDFMLGAPAPHNVNAPVEICRGPVVLVDFSTHNQTGYIEIRWDTSFEEDTRGFNIYRGTLTNQTRMRINTAEIPAHGGSGQINRYTYEDRDVEMNVTYIYYLEDVDLNNNSYLSDPLYILYENPSAVTLNGLNASSGATPVIGIALAGVTGLLAAGWLWRQRE